MTRSTNDFAKYSGTSASGFAEFTPTAENGFSAYVTVPAQTAWEGDNISGNVYGDDNLLYGTAYGIDEFGGLVHFANANQPEIDHT